MVDFFLFRFVLTPVLIFIGAFLVSAGSVLAGMPHMHSCQDTGYQFNVSNENHAKLITFAWFCF